MTQTIADLIESELKRRVPRRCRSGAFLHVDSGYSEAGQSRRSRVPARCIQDQPIEPRRIMALINK